MNISKPIIYTIATIGGLAGAYFAGKNTGRGNDGRQSLPNERGSASREQPELTEQPEQPEQQEQPEQTEQPDIVELLKEDLRKIQRGEASSVNAVADVASGVNYVRGLLGEPSIGIPLDDDILLDVAYLKQPAKHILRDIRRVESSRSYEDYDLFDAEGFEKVYKSWFAANNRAFIMQDFIESGDFDLDYGKRNLESTINFLENETGSSVEASQWNIEEDIKAKSEVVMVATMLHVNLTDLSVKLRERISNEEF